MLGCRSLARVAAAVAVVEEAVVHLEPAERIPADVTSRGVIGRQGGRESVGVCLGRMGCWGKARRQWLMGGCTGRFTGRCEIGVRTGWWGVTVRQGMHTLH